MAIFKTCAAFAALLAALWPPAALCADAPRPFPWHAPEAFYGLEPLADAELDRMRGGFVAPGGLLIDFTLSNRTLIDGEIISDFSLSAAELQTLSSPETLKRVVQLGDANNLALEELQNNPGVTLVIQNSLDEKVIQNFSILDVTVSNFTRFQNNRSLNNAIISANVEGRN